MQFMPSLRHKVLNQEKEERRNSNKLENGPTVGKESVSTNSRKGSRSESRGGSLSTSSTFSKRQKERDKIVFESQAAPRKKARNGANPMELMPSLRHKATSPKKTDNCKHGGDEGSRGRSRSRNRCRSLSSTFASRSRSTSRSRAEEAKVGDDDDDKGKIKPRSRSRSVSWGRRENLGDKKPNLPSSTRYGHLKPAIKKPEIITVPIHTPFKSPVKKEEDKNAPCTETPAVHPPWRYGAEMSSSTETSVSHKSSSSMRRSHLEQRERRVSAFKTWPSDATTAPPTTTTECNEGEVLHLPVSSMHCCKCKDVVLICNEHYMLSD